MRKAGKKKEYNENFPVEFIYISELKTTIISKSVLAKSSKKCEVSKIAYKEGKENCFHR